MAETDFHTRYAALNANQKKAVDAIDGPVMVVAGPGTGKTELLSVRVANILHKTDTLPQNILCLTFTDSGAVAMRERLAGLIGPEAYKVAIHTFHSFGSEVINSFGDKFYHGAHFRPADELSSYEILTEILEKLPHNNPLSSTMNGAFTHMQDLATTISYFKKSGLTPDELSRILDSNDAFIEWVQPRLQSAFGATMSKKQFPAVAALLSEISSYEDDPLLLIGYQPLHKLILETLHTAYTAATDEGSTKPLSAWKKAYLQKNVHGEQALRDAKTAEKLRPSVKVYYEYLNAMQEHELYDYDDMILRVVHAMEVFDDLRFELQETYQYILVDEFQDTNDAQMRLIWNLTNNAATNGRPNLLVVGDDDQAIYRFQGANMSNIIDFTHRYSDVQVITLTDNYRSGAAVLELARSVIVQGTERLETTLENIDKTLTPHRDGPATAMFSVYDTEDEAHYSLARQIAEDYRTDSSRSRAVIARNHRQLAALLPHLQACDIPLRYERQEDILESEPVIQLELVGRIVSYIATQRFDDANELLPQMLAHPAWAIPPHDLWELSLKAHKNRRFWLEEMLESPGRLKDCAEWLIITSHMSLVEPLETMCDHLFGVAEYQPADSNEQESNGPLDTGFEEDFRSPYRAYFFPQESLETHPARHLAWLSALQKLRSKLREFRPDQVLYLNHFIEFLDIHREMGLSIQGKGDVEHDRSAVVLLTAHKSKGLEFDSVYITDAHEHIWGSSARSRARLINFPSNLALAPAGDSDDERLRLLYVALTRARSELLLVAGRRNSVGKEILPVGSVRTDVLELTHYDPLPTMDQIKALSNDWRAPVYDVSIATKEQLLQPYLERYKLSATHLNNFLDIPRGGPQLFLLHNLLRFPQALSPSAAYGSAIHNTLQRAHAHLSATNKRRPVEDVLHDFEESLRQFQLPEGELAKQLHRGSEVLTAFLAARYSSFSPRQIPERDFSTDTIRIGEATITGKLDLIDIDTDEKTIFITDYKTGKPTPRWQGKTDYEKIKLHHYEQQLMMYKLLVENSRQFAGYTVTGARIEYVEPDARGEVVLLDYTYNAEKMAEFSRLLEAVWRRIQALDFDADGDYELNMNGILSFEQKLLTYLQ